MRSIGWGQWRKALGLTALAVISMTGISAQAAPAAEPGTVVESRALPLSGSRSPAAPAPQRAATYVDFQGVQVSPEARNAARLAFEGGDAQGRPFAVVDKKEARLLVFSAAGQLVGATPALLGLAKGDSVDPNVGQMVQTGIPAELRTTPSGRYDSIAGPNLKGERVIWVDYNAAFAIHRLRPSAPAERRAERLASPSPDDNRISLGCVVVSGEFFDRTVLPVLGRGPGVVYVLPEPDEQPAGHGPVAMGGSTRSSGKLTSSVAPRL